MKRKLSITLCALMCAQILASCGGTGSTTPDDTTTSGSQDTTTSADTTAAVAELPEFDLENYELRILKRDQSQIKWAPNKFAPEEENGDILNDAYYQRNAQVSEKYGFTIKETIMTGADPHNDIQKIIAAGDDMYDVVLMQLSFAQSSYDDGFLNFHEMKYIDLEQSYWDQALIRDMTINGKLGLMSGDIITQSRNDSVLMLIYNRPMAEDYQIEDLYQVVRDGKWTYELLNQYSKLVSADLNDEMSKDENDRYGVVFSGGDVGPSHFASCGVQLFTQAGDDYPEFTAKAERAYTAFEKIQQIFSNTEISFNQATGKATNKMAMLADMVETKRSLFQVMSPGTIQREEFREVTTEFGMIPMPKLDADQEAYTTSLGNAAINMYLPATIAEPEKVGYILEALARGSGDLVETYFTKALNGKYTRDEESYEMIRLAVDSVVYDMGFMYDFGKLGSSIRDGLQTDTTNYSSLIASLETASQTAMETAIDKMAGN
ncbi:MAG: hypothetical protein IJ493_10585 [Clostridia bacterium]|nr:hypothetical protein [Clostridia bacterium]